MTKSHLLMLCALLLSPYAKAAYNQDPWGLHAGFDFARAGTSNATGIYGGVDKVFTIKNRFQIYSEANFVSVPTSIYYAGLLAFPRWEFGSGSLRYHLGVGGQFLLSLGSIGRKSTNFNLSIGGGVSFPVSDNLGLSFQVRNAWGLQPLNTNGNAKLNGIFLSVGIQFLTPDPLADEEEPKKEEQVEEEKAAEAQTKESKDKTNDSEGETENKDKKMDEKDKSTEKKPEGGVESLEESIKKDKSSVPKEIQF